MHSPLRVRKDAPPGFTLPEVILVCVIIGIMAAIAIPRFSSWLPNYRFRSAARDLLANFQLARLTRAFCPNGLSLAGGTVYLKNTKGKTASVALAEAGNLHID